MTLEERPITSASLNEAQGACPGGAATRSDVSRRRTIAILTGGGDKPYALGLAATLMAQGISFDFIGSDDLDVPELRGNPAVNFLNLRGKQRARANRLVKVLRVLRYYVALLLYAATAQPRIFHILWNNKAEFFDRTCLMLYYRLLGKSVVLTAHNVNARKRDGNDSFLNRLTLRIQYRLSHHIFVHTQKMKDELSVEFGVPFRAITVIPFGINNTVPSTALSASQARRMLDLEDSHKVLLFFGNIAPYKGLEYLIDAFASSATRDAAYRLVIAGNPKGCADYWRSICERIDHRGVRDRIVLKIEYVPDAQTEIYFKAADVLVLPYTHVFQSGVLFLGYNFGLPVIAADVGSLREDIVEDRTGFVFQPGDSGDLARSIERYFASELYCNLKERRPDIRNYAQERHSWTTVGQMTKRIYQGLLEA